MPDTLHPVLLHFPIVMLIVGSISLWIAVWKPDFYNRLANFMLVGGVITMVPTMITGMRSTEYAIETFQVEEELILAHQNASFVTFGVFLALVILKLIFRKKPNRIVTGILLALSIIGIVMLFISSDYGGRIVYG
ncbi:DUF2231 domain-containing protein [Xylanibacillus composti]|uniref:DUF2231 domain-containing protein n=1 Tax=Xylanibacillus composti TaxID=1572762 RepID=A0A8J4H0A0_9BACL|nr:DUF2231 domain-containing protein [Xylanibacillus composti]MDT9726836.1 DUF2231 domain-containing protein [Xylanibacillus composti]GIQ67180.1 hypothetical protein XYCOK13_00040 [Xylanibacillus composti]